MATEIIFKSETCEWLDVETPNQEDLKYLHDRYAINSLMLEDTTDPNHLPKFEKDGETLFFLMRENTELERQNLQSISDITTKLGVFLVGNTIITVHRMKNRSIYELKKDIFGLENPTKEIIALELALKVMKSFDDEAVNLLETLDNIENEIFLKNTNSSNQIRRLYRMKRKAGLNSRILSVSGQWVDKFKILDISESEFTNLKDKHTDAIADFDHLTSTVTNLISLFLALTDQKANQVMKLLAIYSVYFLPITFIAGLYGMNFDNMPELHHKYGYFATLGLMALVVIFTFIYFRGKKY